jgi:hypothetical protein
MVMVFSRNTRVRKQLQGKIDDGSIIPFYDAGF